MTDQEPAGADLPDFRQFKDMFPADRIFEREGILWRRFDSDGIEMHPLQVRLMMAEARLERIRQSCDTADEGALAPPGVLSTEVVRAILDEPR